MILTSRLYSVDLPPGASFILHLDPYWEDVFHYGVYAIDVISYPSQSMVSSQDYGIPRYHDSICSGIHYYYNLTSLGSEYNLKLVAVDLTLSQATMCVACTDDVLVDFDVRYEVSQFAAN